MRMALLPHSSRLQATGKGASRHLHTSILPFSLAEVILRPHCYPLKKKGLALLAAASLAYVSRVLWIYSETGTWVYPVFAKLSPVGLAAFFSLSYVFSVGIYLFGEKLNHWKWGQFISLLPTETLLRYALLTPPGNRRRNQ
ncbi:hypothetical protein J1605_004533 [Eschrichtius robustus]|uniref:Androgen-dependent TFPI-regulating protein n=1 Tax=Eschrichtius robustus TaxID=9764 RepID=A0AB34HIF3_ESCRO|nr:hypothetical protein J1605_004533 [Eschrichtius robustus]